PIGHRSCDPARGVTVDHDRGDDGLSLLRRTRPFGIGVVHTLRVEPLAVAAQPNIEDTAAVALAIVLGWVPLARPREQLRPRLLAAAVQVAIDLVDEAARDGDVDRRTHRHQDGAQEVHAPGAQAPANACEQPVHGLIVWPTPRTVRISGRLNPRSNLSRR